MPFNFWDFNTYSNYYEIGVYTKSLTKIIEQPLSDYTMWDLTGDFLFFAKCIHLEGEAGVFIFYKATIYDTYNYAMDTYPIILFKVFDGSNLNDYFSSISYIAVDQKTFNDYSLLNDIIKISKTKLCFISTSDAKDELYIVLYY